ncbi:MAG: HEAT repeat domain-containing protein [Candidatus Obscuribacter sp.]|jgi:aminopeptidase N|nr:HEAT repeat domain-containing protein [Candidatus Obscuribacter sp.]
MAHLHAELAGNLSEHASCCGHTQWWRNLNQRISDSERKPFAQPGTKKRYAPDLTVKVHHVKLVLAVDPVRKTLGGHCLTTIEPIAKPVSSIFFAAEDLKIEKVTVAGKDTALKFEDLTGGIKIELGKTLNKGEQLTIDITYQVQSPKLGVYFTGPTAFYTDKPYQVWTQGQDDDSHNWFPVAEADHPNHKMTSEVVVTVPKGYTALSNGALLSSSDDTANNTSTFHWHLDKPHSCYLMALAVGEFVKLEESYKDIKVEVYVHPSLKERAIEYIKGTADLVALYSRLYGVEYAWAYKYAQVFVQDFIFGGMENTTITVMTDRVLGDAGTREEQRLAEVRLNAHELNHHWNGDLVTCNEWSHGWLNEGGATYGEVEAVEAIWGEKARDHYVYGLARTYFAEDARYRRPIVCHTYKEPIDLFDRHLYQKGGLVRHMLRYLVGTQAYYDSIKTYYQDNMYRTVETLDMIKAFEKTTGRNLRPFFDQWVFGAGYPEYKVTYAWDDKQKLATVKVQQTQKIEGDTGLFTMPIEMSFDFADGSRKPVVVTVSEAEHNFSFALDKKPAMFRFDPGNWVLKKLNLSVPKGMLVHQVQNDPSVMGRIYAAQTLAQMGGDDVAAILGKAAKTRLFWGVGAEIAAILGTMKTDAARDALKGLVKVKHPKVRRSVVNALGNYKDESVAKLLADLVTSGKEKSQFVLADAVNALGRTGSKLAFDVLKEATTRASWNDIIAIGALSGLAELKDDRAVAIARELAGSGKPMQARPAAIACLGKYAEKSEDALTALHDLAESEEGRQFTLRMSIVNAIGTAKSASSLPVLDKLKGSSHDGRVKRLITETADTIRSAAKDKGKDKANAAAAPEADANKTPDLDDKVKSLTEQVAQLTSTVASLAAKRKGRKNARKKKAS